MIGENLQASERIFNVVKEAVDKGRLGLNQGLPHGFDRLNEYIPGIQKSTYYLIGAESSSGKSAFTCNTFMLNPIDYYLLVKDKMDIKLDIHLYSFEVPKIDIFAKAICRDIYKRYGILLDINYILSKGNKYKVSDEHYKLVLESARRLDEINDIIHVRDIPTNPTGIWMDMINFGKKNGSGIDEHGVVKDYKPYHNNHYVLVIIDHISLALKERGFNTKEVIDKISEYLVFLRNKLGITPVVVQQLNRSLSSTDRFKLGRVEPQLSDFKDSGNSIQDANVVMTLFSPNRYELQEHRDYDIGRLKDRYRGLSVLKNRDGEADKHLGVCFVGECGLFKELPRSKDMNENVYSQIQAIKKSYKEI